MQEQRRDNVVSLFGNTAANVGQTQVSQSQEADETAELAFHEVMRRNAENQKRLKQDRNKANKSVLRSYRIKT